MNRLKVESSSIHSMGWDETGSEVQYHTKECATVTKGHAGSLCDCKGGKVYHYPGVPEELHNAVLAAPSIGRAFMSGVKNARHPKTGDLLYPHVERKATEA